jgi:hypothetical protein
MWGPGLQTVVKNTVVASKHGRLAEKTAIEQEKNTGTVTIICLFKPKALWLSTVQ